MRIINYNYNFLLKCIAYKSTYIVFNYSDFDRLFKLINHFSHKLIGRIDLNCIFLIKKFIHHKRESK